jgi:hypothetical protein
MRIIDADILSYSLFQKHERRQRPKKKSHPTTRFKPQTKKATQSNPFQKLLT